MFVYKNKNFIYSINITYSIYSFLRNISIIFEKSSPNTCCNIRRRTGTTTIHVITKNRLNILYKFISKFIIVMTKNSKNMYIKLKYKFKL